MGIRILKIETKPVIGCAERQIVKRIVVCSDALHCRSAHPIVDILFYKN